MADQVSSLFSQKWFEELEKTKTFLTEIDSQIAGLVKDRRDIQIQIKGVDTLKEFNALAQKLQVLTDNLVSANGKYSNSQARTANTTKLLTAETAKARVEQQQHNKTMTDAAKQAIGLMGAYDALNAEHVKLSKVARDAAATFGIESEQFKATSDKANEAGAKLAAIDQKLGNYRRNVGNYASGWNGLGNAINQLSREAPAFAVSLQTGFLAISNNLPILADEIRRIRIENDALTAQGKPTVSVLKQIAGALISWQTALSLGVTLLTVYGKDIANWVSNLFKADEALKKLQEEQKQQKELQEEINKNAGESIGKFKILYETINDVTLSEKQRNAAVDELQQMYPAYFGNLSNEAILAGNVGDAYVRLTDALISKAKAQAFQERLNKLVSEELTMQEELAKVDEDIAKNGFRNRGAKGNNFVIASNQVELEAANLSQKRKEIDDKINENRAKQLDFTNRILNAESKSFDLEKRKTERIDKPGTTPLQQAYERDLIIQKSITENESIELEARITALQRAAKDREGIARENVKLEKITADELKTELVKIDTETADERNKIIDKYYENYQKEFEAHVKKQEQNALAQADNIHIIYRNQYDNEIEELKKKNLTKRQFEKQSAAIAKRIALDEVNKQIESLEQIRFAYAQLQMDVSDIDKQLETLKDKRSKLNTNKGVDQSAFNTLGVSDEDVSKIQQALDIYGKFSQALTGFTDIFQQQSQHRIDSINAEIEAIKTRSDAEIEALENAGLSEEEKQDKIDEIKARAAEKEQQLLDKRRQEQKKQAAFQKASDIASIISGTAVAVVAALGSKPFTPFNIALAAIVGTLGAAQLTAALASPLPQFYTGTESSPEGLAKVGERGSELMVMPDGRMFVTPNQETIAWLQKGTKIYPHEETKNIMRVLNRDSTQMPVGSITDYKLHSLIKDQTSEIVGAVKRIGNVSVNQRYPGWFSDWSIQKTR